MALIKKNNPYLSAKDRKRHQVDSMKTTSMTRFFKIIPKQTNSSEDISAVNQNSLPTDSMAIASGTSADEGQVDVDLMVDSSVVHEPVPQSCEGIFPNFRPSKKSPKKKADFSNALLLYGTNCVVSDR